MSDSFEKEDSTSLWFLLRNPRALGEVEDWLKAKKTEFANRHKIDGGCDADYVAYSAEQAVFGELLADIQKQYDINFPPIKQEGQNYP